MVRNDVSKPPMLHCSQWCFAGFNGTRKGENGIFVMKLRLLVLGFDGCEAKWAWQLPILGESPSSTGEGRPMDQ